MNIRNFANGSISTPNSNLHENESLATSTINQSKQIARKNFDKSMQSIRNPDHGLKQSMTLTKSKYETSFQKSVPYKMQNHPYNPQARNGIQRNQYDSILQNNTTNKSRYQSKIYTPTNKNYPQGRDKVQYFPACSDKKSQDFSQNGKILKQLIDQIELKDKIIADLQSQIPKKPRQLSQSTKTDSTLTELKRKMQKQNDCLRLKNQQMESKMKELNKKLGEQTQKNKFQHTLETQLQRTKNQLLQNISEQNTLTLELSKQKSELIKAKNQLKSLKVTCNQKDSSITQLKEKINQIKRKLEFSENQCEEAIKLLHISQAQTQYLKQQLTLLREDDSSYFKQFGQASSEKMESEQGSIYLKKKRSYQQDAKSSNETFYSIASDPDFFGNRKQGTQKHKQSTDDFKFCKVLDEDTEKSQMRQTIITLKSINQKCFGQLSQIKKEKEKIQKQLSLLTEQCNKLQIKNEMLQLQIKQVLQNHRLRRPSKQQQARIQTKQMIRLSSNSFNPAMQQKDIAIKDLTETQKKLQQTITQMNNKIKHNQVLISSYKQNIARLNQVNEELTLCNTELWNRQ